MKKENKNEYDFKIARTSADFVAAQSLFTEYANSLDFDLAFQNFEQELQEIHLQYDEPYGGLILVIDRNMGKAIGCVGVRKFEDGIGELKRMYIQDAFRGQGIGKELLHYALLLTKELGYQKLRLDTVGSMKSAIAVYESAGFYEIEPYRFNPNSDTKFFEIEVR